MLIRAAPWMRSASRCVAGGGSSRPVSATITAPDAIQPASRSRSNARRTRSLPYGGSRKTRSHVGPGGTARASAGRTVQRLSACKAVMLVRRTASAARSRSMNVACAAPRDSASRPNAPVPANTSRTWAPSTASRPPHGACSSISNNACRTRSAVGRVWLPGGAISVLPRQRPATILICVGTQASRIQHGVGRSPQRATEKVRNALRAKRLFSFSVALCGISVLSVWKPAFFQTRPSHYPSRGN